MSEVLQVSEVNNEPHAFHYSDLIFSEDVLDMFPQTNFILLNF